MAKVKEQEIIVEEDRKNICVLVIDAILEEEPSRLIESAAFQCLANELCEIFPGTSPVSYIRTFLPKTPLEKQRNLSGPLYKAYIKKREKTSKEWRTAAFSKIEVFKQVNNVHVGEGLFFEEN